MVHVIAAPCIADFSCLEICPVSCIAPGPQDRDFDDAEQLYIDPGVCINCGACKDVCPVLAIYEEADLPSKWAHYSDVNRDYFRPTT